VTPTRPSFAGRFALALAILLSVSCSDAKDTTPTAVPPALTSVAVSLPASTIVMGQSVTATAAGLDQDGAAFTLGTVAWSTSSTTVATVTGAGVVTGLTAGTVQVVATVGGVTGQTTLTVVAPAAIKINEIESNGGTPGDWVELYNSTAASVDVSGWVIKDNDDSHSYALPAGTSIAAGGYLVAEEANLGFGLGAPDAVRLYNQFAIPVDSYNWDTHATTTYGRCPNATGTFATTASSTKGAANACTAPGATTAPWPGSDDVQTVDGTSVFGGNLSGLIYEPANGSAPAVLWGARNGPGSLFRLMWNGTIWTPDTTNGWGAGKLLHYGDGQGEPDSEGVTYGPGGSAGGIYISAERNNSANGTSRNSVLRFDASQSGASLTATNEWNLTSDLPAVGANLGIEAITWIPDTILLARGFYDEGAGHAYNPSEYGNHGTGLFFVGVEANGMVYAYALDHVTNGFKRVATIATSFAGVMELAYDREVGYLWATCDDGCGNQSSILQIDGTAGSSTLGRFKVSRVFERPTSMPNINNEGFAMASQSECVSGRKPVFWADDSETGGHSIRRASIPCGAFLSAQTP
jgi:hypothetical protein